MSPSRPVAPAAGVDPQRIGASFVALVPDDLEGQRTVTTRDKFGQVTVHQAVTFPVGRLHVEVGGSLHVA